MAPFGSCRLLVSLTLAVSCYSAIVFKDDEFIFPLNCERNESGKLVRNLGSDRDLTVAVLQDGVWKPTERYRDRIRENSSIVFNRTFYSDSSKAYELSCGKRPLKRVSLKVLVPYEVTGSVGQTVTLPCFSNDLASYVLWQKDGTDLCAQNSDNCNRTDDRLSVSSSHGDLSLTISGVRPEDQGKYLCFIKDKKSNKESGSPVGVRLKVTHQITNQTQKSCRYQIIFTVIITAAVMLVVFAASILVWRHRSAASSRTVAAEMTPLQNHTSSQANGGTLSRQCA